MNVIWRILAFVVMVAQAWYTRFLVASNRGRVFWASIPLIGLCMLCGIVQSAGQSAGLIAVAPTGTPRATGTPRPTDAPQPTDVPRPTQAPAPTEIVVEPTPGSDAAALLPPVTTQAPPVEETIPPVVAAPTTAAQVAPAGPPTGTSPNGGRVRDQPTTEGSTPIGSLAAGETVTLRQRTPDGTWYAVETRTGLVG